jgi:hypothetical protein
MQDNYLLSYGHATTNSAMDQAKDLTTVVLLHIDVKSHELSLIGCNTLPGESQVAVSQTTNGNYNHNDMTRSRARMLTHSIARLDSLLTDCWIFGDVRDTPLGSLSGCFEIEVHTLSSGSQVLLHPAPYSAAFEDRCSRP